MSAQQPISNKGDIVISPKTGRSIKVGSRIWLKLVKDGIISGEYSDDNVMANIITMKVNNKFKNESRT